MLKEIFISVLGFGLGAFMVLNSLVVLSRISNREEWVMTQAEKMTSAGVTAVVGIVLLAWTFLLLRKRQAAS